jgi:peptidoglycan/xylan/chitin deacetylase (PgdA/CDA1 family)
MASVQDIAISGGFMGTLGDPEAPVGEADTGEEPGTSICEVAVTGPVAHVVITYDDGPEPAGTEGILQALADAGATATFFVLLSRVRRHPGLFAEMVAAGHEIGLHGGDHRSLPGLEPAVVQRNTVAAKQELQEILGRSVRWCRPPYGDQSPASWRAVKSAGLTPVLWSATLLDWEDVTTETRLAEASQIQGPGAILLAHDGFAGPDDGVDDGPPPQFDRGDLTRRLLERYGERGLVGCSLGQALQSGSPVERTWLTHDQ